LQADDRRIAEAHYKLSLTLHFLDDPEDALTHARSAAAVCNARIASLAPAAAAAAAAEPAADGAAAAEQDCALAVSLQCTSTMTSKFFPPCLSYHAVPVSAWGIKTLWQAQSGIQLGLNSQLEHVLAEVL